ncbi:MAG: hypothetical protein LBU82_02290 [Treponema sp.]|jgi:hypothetical protein|nr:hypothetical protein [Treponema sp.]
MISVDGEPETFPVPYLFEAMDLRIDPEGDGVTGDNGNLDANNTARIKGGTVIGRAQIKAKSGDEGKYGKVTIDLEETVTGVHNLVFVFYSSNGANPETVIPHQA